MKRLRVLVPAVVVIALLLMMIAPLGAAAAPPQSGGSWCSQWYKVHRGDTLGNIAWRYHTTAGHLARINHIPNPNLIYPGQVICVRGGGGGHHPGGGFWYTVQRGDTLNKIAHRFGWNMWYLANINHIHNPDVIYTGQKLWIPAHW